MPCNTVQTSKLKLSNDNIDFELFDRTMKRMGYTKQGKLYVDKFGNTVEFVRGELVTNMSYGAQFNMNEFETQYTRSVAEEACNQFGWSMQEVETDEFDIQKGY